ncbi:signal recognition particle 19 kDa protein isoform X2 [Cajanus cajan]|uniref:signal recognition particle 19 kDa protein isoform X2 n=1 Tax=Cajanus cajan TaxID=3821 RepID=UPI0010FBB9B2|nr:signal recognition particle 19 kDa protein isoform X2 [Cajanus cajan]
MPSLLGLGSKRGSAIGPTSIEDSLLFSLLPVFRCVSSESEDSVFDFPIRLSVRVRNMDGAELPNIKKWIVMYPVYINSKKTMAEGRRIGLAKACENPTCAEIGDCCSYLKLPFAIEIDKAYPRDFMQRGRVRVLLKKEDGTLFNSSISSSFDVFSQL